MGSHSLLRGLPEPGIEPGSPTLQADFLLSEPPRTLLPAFFFFFFWCKHPFTETMLENWGSVFLISAPCLVWENKRHRSFMQSASFQKPGQRHYPSQGLDENEET